MPGLGAPRPGGERVSGQRASALRARLAVLPGKGGRSEPPNKNPAGKAGQYFAMLGEIKDRTGGGSHRSPCMCRCEHRKTGM